MIPFLLACALAGHALGRLHATEDHACDLRRQLLAEQDRGTRVRADLRHALCDAARARRERDAAIETLRLTTQALLQARPDLALTHRRPPGRDLQTQERREACGSRGWARRLGALGTGEGELRVPGAEPGRGVWRGRGAPSPDELTVGRAKKGGAPKLIASPEELAAQEAEEATSSLPGVNVLAGLVFELTQQAAITRARQRHELEKGLVLHTYPTDQGVGVSLSRPDAPPSGDEVQAVVAATGWWFVQERRTTHQGRHYVLIERSQAPPERPAEPAPPRGDDDPPDGQIRRLLLGPGPWRNSLLTPAMREGREDAVKALKRPELRAEFAWASRHWPEAVAAALRVVTGGTNGSAA